MVSFRVIIIATLSAAIFTATFVAIWGAGGFGSNSSNGSTAPPTVFGLGVAVHLFEWRYDDVADECANYLGKKGYRYVQVSPPYESRDISYPYWNGLVVHAWSGRYQPVSYRINSRSGTEAMFANMVQVCAQQGIGIMVDMVTNHMAGGDSTCGNGNSGFCQNNGCGSRAWNFGQGCVGSSFSAASYGAGSNVYNSVYQFPNFTDSSNGVNCNYHFHHAYCQGNLGSAGGLSCQGAGCNPSISDYSNWNQVKYNDLSGLSDLATENTQTQYVIAAYACYLLKLGVTAFRMDAGKHQQPGDIDSYLNLGVSCARSTSAPSWWPSSQPFSSTTGAATYPLVYLEVIDSDGTEAVKATDYTSTSVGNGGSWLISDFGYERNIASTFRGSQITWLLGGVKNQPGLATPGINSAHALVFTDNHDDQRGMPQTVITYAFAGAQYTNANVYMLTANYGFPLVMSSYNWIRNCNGQSCNSAGGDLNAWVGPPSDVNGHTNSIYARYQTQTPPAAYPSGLAVPLPYGGNPAGCFATLSGSWNNVGATGGWICEHRWQAIANAVGWRNVVNTGSWSLWNTWGSSDGMAIAYSRDGDHSTCSFSTRCVRGGWVAINNGGNSYSPGFFTGLPDGYYCNLWQDDYDSTSFIDQNGNPIAACVNGRGDTTFTNNVIRVSGGWAFQGNVNPNTYVAVTLQPYSGIMIHTVAQIAAPGVVPTLAPTTPPPAPVLGPPICGPTSSASSYDAASGSSLTLICNSTLTGVTSSSITYSVTGLPTGLTATTVPPASTMVNAQPSLVIAGSVAYSVTGSFSLSITAQLSGQSQSSSFTLTFALPPGVLSLPSASYNLPVGTALSPSLNTLCGSACATYAISPALPPGLTFSTTTGTLSGTPTAVATSAQYLVTSTATTQTFSFYLATYTPVVPLCTHSTVTLHAAYNAWVDTPFSCVSSGTWQLVTPLTQAQLLATPTTVSASQQYNFVIMVDGTVWSLPSTAAKPLSSSSTGTLIAGGTQNPLFAPTLQCQLYTITWQETSGNYQWSYSPQSGCTPVTPTAAPSPPPVIPTLFSVTKGGFTTGTMLIVGNAGVLGSWTASAGIGLSYSSSTGLWSGTINLAPSTQYQFKAIHVVNGAITWQCNCASYSSNSGCVSLNYAFTTPASGTATTPTLTWC